ncbi:MAG: thiamine diphosphokinase [Actinobacteria bacterium]|nr:thiamine diphosphokinase [Actinomycetota bacterium]
MAIGPASETVVLVAGGEPLDARLACVVPPGAPVVAADSGLDHALALGLRPDLVVGDLDSASPGAVALAASRGARIDRHPAAKDATDLDLAVAAAVEAYAPDRLVVLSGGGGRADHLLSLPALVTAPSTAALRIEAWCGRALLLVARPGRPVTIDAPAGSLVSVLPAHGPARGIELSGLLWSRTGLDLAAGSTRGISNVVDRPPVRISVTAGTLLIVRPDAVDSLPDTTVSTPSHQRTEERAT